MKPTDTNPPLKITITRIFDAPRSLVFEAWTKPEHLTNWCAPHGFTVPESNGDLRPGGKWWSCMVAPDGGKLPVGGVYKEVIVNELLVFTHCWEKDNGEPSHETLVTVRFADEGDRTRMTFEQTHFKSEESRDGHLDGWSQCMERLSTLLDRKEAPFVIERIFDAPVSLVWKAITDKDCFKNWYFDIPEFRPEVGCEFEFVAGCEKEKFRHLCRVTKVIPEKELSYTWRYEGYEGNSLVTFTLLPEGGHTRLRLTHEGLDTFPALPVFERTNFAKGWTSLIGSCLKQFLEGNAGDK